ncbi:MAG: hypothetical protein ACJAS1_005555 [Oleiphilaceae bacterium]
MNNTELYEFAAEFRSTIEGLGQSKFAGTSLASSNFPAACCDDASILLAKFLEENGYREVNLIHGSSGGENKDINSHDWLLVDCTIVDITADQFNWKNYSNHPVIIQEQSAFHLTFVQENKGPALATERAIQNKVNFNFDYQEIKNNIDDRAT